jgi:RNA-directed DNA polymerase
VVEVDLEQFFARVNHDLLMARLAQHVRDTRLLGLIRRFLKAGILCHGVCIERYEGTPPGGPLSPVLANLLLDDLDKELERRGHRFCRYADDCHIYVRTPVAGARVMRSVTRFLEQTLKLKVTEKKSAVARVDERPFLGYRLREEGTLAVASQSLERVKMKIRQMTRRTRGVSLARVIRDLTENLPGWVRYFRYEKYGSVFRGLDQWIRRRLRCYVLKQKKRPYTVTRYLQSLVVPVQRAWSGACQCRGWWRASQHPAVKEGIDLAWFKDQGLCSLTERFELLQSTGNRRIR